MVKTITIKDSVYNKLIAHKTKDESFSDLFERLIDENFPSSINILKKFRGSVEFDKDDKDTMFKDIAIKRAERRI
jgi:predicted CopG family antitoxin